MARMKPNKPRFQRHYFSFFAAVLTFGVLCTVSLRIPEHTAAAAAPTELSDRQFWSLSKDSSEEDGYFRSDNLLSNETSFQYILPDLLKSAKQGRVYLGVGPEQNFTYIAALKPTMAIIIDIRHGNLDVHLMYKALFELSKDRSEFVARLFSRKRATGLTTKSNASEIFTAYLAAEGSKEIYEENLKAVEDVLTKKHGFPLTSGDLEGIRWALGNYYQFGPSINYNSSLSANVPPAIVGAIGGNRGGNNGVTYASLMTADDGLDLRGIFGKVPFHRGDQVRADLVEGEAGVLPIGCFPILQASDIRRIDAFLIKRLRNRAGTSTGAAVNEHLLALVFSEEFLPLLLVAVEIALGQQDGRLGHTGRLPFSRFPAIHQDRLAL